MTSLDRDKGKTGMVRTVEQLIISKGNNVTRFAIGSETP